ncbi:MAG: methyltransferase domain-containing protein [Pseudolabrys sp.]
MNIHVNRNLALDAPADFAGPPQVSDARAELAAQFIPAGSRVLDLSAGRRTLEDFLPAGCSYQSRDRVTCDGGAECNIARGDFPTKAATQSDIIVMLGLLEQIADVESFFTHLRFAKQDVVLSYSATDLTGGQDRVALGFANHLSFYDLTRLFDRYGFRIECTAPIDDSQSLMRLTATDRLRPVAPCSVAVVSCHDDNNFGDPPRLPHDQRAAAGRGGSASPDLPHAARSA